MGKHNETVPPVREATQILHPWRAVVRTLVAALAGLAAAAGPIYTAVTGQDPVAATGWAAVMLAITGAVTRVLAVPQVDEWMHLFVPWLATGEHAQDH